MGEEKQWFSLAISDKDLVHNGTLLENRREARSNMSGRESSDDGYSAEEEMVELTRRSNLGEMSPMSRQSKDESTAMAVLSDASGTPEDQHNRLQLTKENEEPWFALEEFNPPTGGHMPEKQNAENLSLHGNTQNPPSNSIEYATGDINSDIFQNTSVPALTSHGQLWDPSSDHVNKITIETCSLEEGQGMVSDTTDNSIVFPNEAMKYASSEQPTTNKMLNDEISNIAAMQRPEPLGKARVEINSRTPLNPAITGLGISTGNAVSGHIGVERAEAGNPVIGNTLTRYRNSRNGNFENHASEYGDIANQSEVDDSDEGLKEQAYPVRVPLSVSEGYNGLPTDYKQVMSTTDILSRDKQERMPLDTLDGQQLLTEEFQKTYLDALRNNDDKVLQKPRRSEAGLQNETRYTSVKRNQEISRTNTDAATPISKLLGPSYKSSFALLEELKKRRFRNANDKEKSSDVPQKRSELTVNDDSVDGNVDPMKLAENAMKASTILSNRTEKSLKRATEVLEAVKEHRTPPGNSSESFLMGSKEKVDSISAKLRELSLSSLSFDASTNSRNTSDENNDETDSIDRIIEDRLLAQNNLSTPSSLSTLSSGLYGHAEASTEKKSKPLSTKSNEWPSSSDTPSFSSSKSTLEDLDAKYSVSAMLKTVDSHETESSLDDATSSELMRLKSFGEGVESPNNDLLVSKLKLVNPLKDISPIEHHNSRQTAREIGFRSSSRKRKNENVPALKQTNFSDSEIVRLHRSMGAGTVTPLPDLNLDNDISTENNQTLKSSSSFSSASSFKSLRRKEKQNDEGQFDLKQNELGYQSKPGVTEKVANEVVPEKRFDLESQRIPTGKFDFSSTATSIESSVSHTAETDSGAEVQDSYLSGKSIRSLEVVEPPVPARGIYDIRDSSGPGSTNRKRRELGKKPLEGKDKARDPFTVYVSEQSKSSAASSKLVENGRVGKHARKIASNNHRDQAKKFPESSFSSMSSQSPFLSYSGNELSNDDLIAASDLSNRHGDSAPKSQHVSIQDASAGKTSASFRVSEMYDEDQDYSRKSIYSNNEDQGFTEIQAPSSGTGGENVLITEQDSFAKQQDIVTESRHAVEKPSSLRVAWADEPSSRSMPKRTSDFNKLWQKFQERFSPTLASENGDIFQKIGVLSEMINDQAVKIPPTLRDETEVKAKSYYSNKAKRRSFDNNVYKQRSTNATKAASTCSKCNKRDIGTNCPTPVPSECEDDDTDSDKPLLLHTWTQTTPNDAGRKKVEINLRRAPLVKAASSEPIHRLYSSDRDKENSQIQANGSPPSNIENGSKISSSWSVTFEPKKTKEQTNIVSSKPPIPLISKADLKSEGKPANKRREPVFTAWFQSTRSDTSSGTVVPLSEVPKLASNFKEKKHTPKMYIGEVNSKETESIVRVGLQEAFKFANEDFIRRSKERVDGVKNAKLHATRRKNLNNLKERHLEEAVVTNIQNFKHSAKTEHLFQPKKRQINKKEMREQNKKLYEKLPEVVRRREEAKRKAQYESNRERLKQFDKKLRTKLLKLKKI